MAMRQNVYGPLGSKWINTFMLRTNPGAVSIPKWPFTYHLFASNPMWEWNNNFVFLWSPSKSWTTGTASHPRPLARTKANRLSTCKTSSVPESRCPTSDTSPDRRRKRSQSWSRILTFWATTRCQPTVRPSSRPSPYRLSKRSLGELWTK